MVYVVLTMIYLNPSGLLAWIPGQGVKVDHAAIVEILIDQLQPSRES